MNERRDSWSVGAWMTANPASVAPDLLARDAFVKMRSEGYRHLLVLEDGKLVGIVTDRDLRRPTISSDADGWNDYYRLDEDYEVRDVMNTSLLSVIPRDPLEKALGVVTEHKVGALPVLDKNGDVCGILTTHDLMRAFQDALARVGDELRAQ